MAALRRGGRAEHYNGRQQQPAAATAYNQNATATPSKANTTAPPTTHLEFVSHSARLLPLLAAAAACCRDIAAALAAGIPGILVRLLERHFQLGQAPRHPVALLLVRRVIVN